MTTGDSIVDQAKDNIKGPCITWCHLPRIVTNDQLCLQIKTIFVNYPYIFWQNNNFDNKHQFFKTTTWSVYH